MANRENGPARRPTSWWLDMLRRRAERMYEEELDLREPIPWTSEAERQAAIAFFNAAFRAEESGLRQAHELAAEVELSRFHFCKVFQQATGLSPHEYLVQLRIEYARQLLADPKLTITDIALAVGYATPSSFAASFRRVSGITPTAYRRSL